jgi:hypothetical protein
VTEEDVPGLGADPVGEGFVVPEADVQPVERKGSRADGNQAWEKPIAAATNEFGCYPDEDS